MIVCKNCEFEISASMRHALVKNCCPCCGSALLGEIHVQRMELLKRRILEQEFSQELSNDLIFDISLFLLTEFFPTQTKETSDESGEDSEESISEALDEVATGEYENIRDEVRGEILSKMDEDSEDTGLDLKVARLKRIAKEKAVIGKGPSVRRVSD